MKFIPENRKKTIGALALLVVSLGGTIYINFFMGKSNAPVPINPADLANLPGGVTLPGVTPPPAAPGQPLPAGQPSALRPSTLLPFGSKIDISIFDSDKFKALKGAPPVDVNLSELGKTDPFQ